MSELANGESDVEAEAGQEQEATLIKKSVKLESELGEDDGAKKENIDEKTEDQVPDITLEDPMTTSMDGIEEISAAEGEAAANNENGAAEGGDGAGGVQPEQEEGAAAAAEDETTEKDVAEIPVNVYEEEINIAAPTAAADEAVEEGGAEEEDTNKVPGQEEEEEPAAAVEEEREGKEEPAAAADAEQQPEEEEKMVEISVEELKEADEEKVEEQPAAEEKKEEKEEAFELKAPPAPRKPRKPYKPDWMAEPEPKEAEKVEAEEEEKPVEEETPAEQLAADQSGADEISIEVEKFGGEEEKPAAEEAAAEEAPAPEATEEVATTPKSGGAATITPKSQKGRAFDFEKKMPAGKKTTFEDEVLSVKSSRSGRSGPRSPRSPRTPKTPTKTEEEPKPAAEEEAAPPEKSEAELKAEEEARQRQASFEERQREREEEEARWKRMTSWDRGEDGTIKEEELKQQQPAVEPVEEEEQQPKEAEQEEGEEEAKVPQTEEEQEEEGVKVIPVGEEEPKSVAEGEGEPEEKATEGGEEEQQQQPAEGSPPPPPPRPERSPSPVQRREAPAARDYLPYDQDLPKETMPARLPADESFSSWAPVERDSYKPISPWVDRTSKYRNEYTVGEPPVAPTAYTAFFDDLVSTGPFASSLYSTSRLLERSRSRTRERRQALRSQSQARNYFRFASQHPAPLRSRDYSTPPSSMVSRAPTAASSFISFMDYAGAKQYEMARSQSLQRAPLYQSNLALSRSISRGGIDYYLGSGRMSRVDSYVDNLHNRYEWNMPSNYEIYRASSRGQVSFAPLTNYNCYVDSLQRSLSRERYERDRLRNKYTTVSYQLEQAVKQMDLLRSQNYSALRSGSAPRTSVYAHFYPYY